MWTPGVSELVIILAIVLLLFGGRRIPEIAQGLGKGIKLFKEATKEGPEAIEEKTGDSPTAPEDPNSAKS